jgi:hypothetical protein
MLISLPPSLPLSLLLVAANILLAIVLDHYNDARAASQGAWIDSNLLAYLATQARKGEEGGGDGRKGGREGCVCIYILLLALNANLNLFLPSPFSTQPRV